MVNNDKELFIYSSTKPVMVMLLMIRVSNLKQMMHNQLRCFESIHLCSLNIKWFSDSKLYQNCSKSNTLRYSALTFRQYHIHLQLRDCVVECIKSTRFPGILVQTYLQWFSYRTHKQKISAINPSFYALRQLGSVRTQESLKEAYYGILESIMTNRIIFCLLKQRKKKSWNEISKT